MKPTWFQIDLPEDPLGCVDELCPEGEKLWRVFCGSMKRSSSPKLTGLSLVAAFKAMSRHLYDKDGINCEKCMRSARLHRSLDALTGAVTAGAGWMKEHGEDVDGMSDS